MRNKIFSIVRCVACVGVLALTHSGTTSAAIVSYMGQFTSGGGGTNPLLGNIPFPDPIRSYSVSLDFAEATGTINSGTVVVGGLVTFNVSGGSISVLGSGLADTGTLFANFTGPAPGSLTTIVNSGNVITSDMSSAANLNALLANSSFLSTSILNIGGNNPGNYNGSVSAVPEPGSALGCVGLLLVGVFRRRRSHVANRCFC